MTDQNTTPQEAVDDVMTLMFTDMECQEVIKAIEQSNTDNPDLLALRNAMWPNAMKIKRGAFMAYVRESDDEILPGFKLSDHGRTVQFAGEAHQ